MSDLIFGKTWEQIQAMQRGLCVTEYADLSKPGGPAKASESDLALLKEHGINGLESLGFYGVLERLRASGVAGVSEPQKHSGEIS